MGHGCTAKAVFCFAIIHLQRQRSGQRNVSKNRQAAFSTAKFSLLLFIYENALTLKVAKAEKGNTEVYTHSFTRFVLRNVWDRSGVFFYVFFIFYITSGIILWRTEIIQIYKRRTTSGHVDYSA